MLLKVISLILIFLYRYYKTTFSGLMGRDPDLAVRCTLLLILFALAVTTLSLTTKSTFVSVNGMVQTLVGSPHLFDAFNMYT